MDEAVKKRLAREKRKWQREQQKKSDGQKESGKTERGFIAVKRKRYRG